MPGFSVREQLREIPVKNILLIASGSGTDATAIMRAWKLGAIPEVGKIVLLSTREGAGCLTKAAENGAESFTIIPGSSPLNPSDAIEFQRKLSRLCRAHDIGLIFLVGCVVVLPLIEGIPMFNIHPACPLLHGGKKMYGLRVHEHVLLFHLDEIERGKKALPSGDRFFTHPTVHEVTEKPDDGEFLLQGCVEIPKELLWDIQSGDILLTEGAMRLQKLVLPHEWMMLPAAVGMAIARIET
ncbi:MAG: formyltransferase family protein [Candidatus Moraniibacteriota bacterium]